jgi:hypothetical protein
VPAKKMNFIIFMRGTDRDQSCDKKKSKKIKVKNRGGVVGYQQAERLKMTSRER